MSFVMGAGSGGLLFLGSHYQRNGTDAAAREKGDQLVLAVSSVLALMMGLRFMKSGKFMPAGLVFSLRQVLLEET